MKSSLTWFICTDFWNINQAPHPASRAWNSNKNFFMVENTNLFIDLKVWIESEAVLMADVSFQSSLSIFQSHSLSKQPTSKRRLCIKSNLKIGYEATVLCIPTNGNATNIVSSKSIDSFLRRSFVSFSGRFYVFIVCKWSFILSKHIFVATECFKNDFRLALQKWQRTGVWLPFWR